MGEIMSNPKLYPFTDTSSLIDEKKIQPNNKGYVVLVMIKLKVIQQHEVFSRDKILLTYFFYAINTSVINRNTISIEVVLFTVFGYGPMYHQHPATKYTIGKFTISK